MNALITIVVIGLACACAQPAACGTMPVPMKMVVTTKDGGSITGIPFTSSVLLKTARGPKNILLLNLTRIEVSGTVVTVRYHTGGSDQGIYMGKPFEMLLPDDKERRIPLATIDHISLRYLGENLILYYSFDNVNGTTIKDESGEWKPGTIVKAIPTDEGKVACACVVDGKSGYIQTPDDSRWSFGTNPFSINFWMKLTSLPSGEAIIIGHGEGSGQKDKWALELMGGNLQFHINNPRKDKKRILRIAPAPWSPPIDEWHHVTLTREKGVFSIYVDGTCIGTGINGTPVPTISAPLSIGQLEGLGIRGMIDELMIHKRCLTPDEVARIYQEAK